MKETILTNARLVDPDADHIRDGGVVIAERAAGDADEHLRASRLVGRVELPPRVRRLPQRNERRLGVTFEFDRMQRPGSGPL